MGVLNRDAGNKERVSPFEPCNTSMVADEVIAS